ncbi:MAG: acyl-CoA-binding protein [Flammeovirgaceae bacterium]
MNYKNITKEDKLELYALGNQGAKGNVTGSKPFIWQGEYRQLYEAWEKKKGMSQE